MKKTTRLTAAFAAAMLLLTGAGCSGSSEAQTTTTAATTTTAETTTAAPETTTTQETTTAAPETTTTTEAETQAPAAVPESVNIAALKGPTAMGMIKFMDDQSASDVTNYEFEIYAAPDELTPKIIQGAVDFACIPANLASVLYNKTEGEVEVLAVNTLGVLYIVENGGESINSMEDLHGKTIYASGQGSTPEFALNYLLAQNGIDDVTIEWKSEHAECVTAITAGEGGIAMLPQPFVTTAMTKNEGIRVALDLTEEWDKLDNGSSLLTGVVVGRKEFIDAYPDAVKEFMDNYRDSVAYVNSDTDGAAALIGKYDIVPEAVAKKALPACNIVFIEGSEMKEKLSGYLQVLFDSLATSVGGKLPDNDFYYGA